MNRYKPVGWRGESQRHSLARKGIKTSFGVSYKVKGATGYGIVQAKDEVEAKKKIREIVGKEATIGQDVTEILGASGFKGNQDEYLAKLSDIKTEIEPIYDYLQINYDMNDEISGIGLSIPYKDFNKLFPDISKKELSKLFDYLEDNKEATKEVIESLKGKGIKGKDNRNLYGGQYRFSSEFSEVLKRNSNMKKIFPHNMSAFERMNHFDISTMLINEGIKKKELENINKELQKGNNKLWNTKREDILLEGVVELGKKYGIPIKKPIRIDSMGNIMIAVKQD